MGLVDFKSRRTVSYLTCLLTVFGLIAGACSQTASDDIKSAESTSTLDLAETSEAKPGFSSRSGAMSVVADPSPVDESSEIVGTRNSGSAGKYDFNRFGDSEVGLGSTGLMSPTDSPGDKSQDFNASFRVLCQYSHFSSDDPIIFPGEPGKAHLHMFFGNTKTDAYSTKDSLASTGGGTCQGFELNRSAYWFPALVDTEKSQAVVPDQMIIYYKTKENFIGEINRLPQGLQMVAGNTKNQNLSSGDHAYWGCGENGRHTNEELSIPDCGDQRLNASVLFPNCWDGENLEFKKATFAYAIDFDSCPSAAPVRIPQITILLYWPKNLDTTNLALSSDNESHRSGGTSNKGGTLHADWFGGWNDDAMDLFMDNCLRAHRNCTVGQTGTPNLFAKTSPSNSYEGDNFLQLPEGTLHSQ